MQFKLSPAKQLNGEIRVPGDKSISHRSIMFGSIAKGTTHVTGFLNGADCLATLTAFKAMGVNIEMPSETELVVHGVGMRGLKAPSGPLDIGNSGTSIRLMSGLLAGQFFDTHLVGDESLSKRPMRRVTDPLALMGACIGATEQGTAPLHIFGEGTHLHGIHYELPMASAQVKSAVLLAGLYAQGQTSTVQPAITRDHTERMLKGFGYDIEFDNEKASLTGGGELHACEISVPSDISSATFFMVGAAIAEGSNVTLQHVGINPTRTGVINILQEMGADITLFNEREEGGEPVADIRVRGSKLKGIRINPEHVPLAIDEFPALFIAAACAEGETVLTDAEELRVKESDRIQVMADGLATVGIKTEPTPDGIIIQGGEIQGGEIESHHDHRIAMSFAIASLRASEDIIINDCDFVATSFPNFVELALQTGLNIEVVKS